MARETYVLKKRPDGAHELVPRADVSAWVAAHYPDKSSSVVGMPRKVERGSWVWRDGKLVDRYAAPKMAGRLQIIKDIDPFQNIAIDNGYIGGRRQRRDMMRAHDLVEVGNEKPRPHPRDLSVQARDKPMREIVESLKRHSQGKWL